MNNHPSCGGDGTTEEDNPTLQIKESISETGNENEPQLSETTIDVEDNKENRY
jgi:hypothetical protein